MVCPLMIQSGHRRGQVNGLPSNGRDLGLANCAHSATTLKKGMSARSAIPLHLRAYLGLRLFALLRIQLFKESCVIAAIGDLQVQISDSPS
jgi:hypothetical protein